MFTTPIPVGRFWRRDESARVWKESHLLAQKFDKAKPCKNAPIDPVEEESAPAASAGGSSVSTAGAMQDKPLTTVPDAMRPAFDYSGLTDQTVEDLHFAENEYRHGKQMAERGLVHMGNAIAAAHDALCGTVVAQCDNGKFAKKEDTFRAWCVSIGITKDTAYRLLQVSALLDGSSPRQQKILKELSPTLLYAVAKPSAPAELVEQVKSGDITTNKQYQEALAQIKAEKERADAAETERDKLLGAQNRAAWAESHIQDVEAQRDAALADVQGLTEQNAKLQQSYHDADESRIAANLQRQKAEAERDRAETRAQEAEKQLEGSRQMAEAAKLRGDKLKAENDALKKQPITTVVDKEEVDRQAREMAAEMTADLRAQLEQASSGSEQDAHSSYDNVLLADRSFQNIGKMVVPSPPQASARTAGAADQYAHSHTRTDPRGGIQMSVTITALEAENVKRIKAVALTPAPTGLTLVGGNNNQGKTSVLDALAWALGGDRFRPMPHSGTGPWLPPISRSPFPTAWWWSARAKTAP